MKTKWKSRFRRALHFFFFDMGNGWAGKSRGSVFPIKTIIVHVHRPWHLENNEENCVRKRGSSVFEGKSWKHGFFTHFVTLKFEKWWTTTFTHVIFDMIIDFLLRLVDFARANHSDTWQKSVFPHTFNYRKYCKSTVSIQSFSSFWQISVNLAKWSKNGFFLCFFWKFWC